MQNGISSLKYSTAGLNGAAYQKKIEMMDALISQYVEATHTYNTGNEVHFVNAYFNYLAKDWGVPERVDKFTSIAETQISNDQLEACKKKVLSKLTPSALTTAIADDYLSRIKGAVAEQYIDVNAPVDNRTFDITQNINEFLNPAFGDVSADNYLLLGSDAFEVRLAQQSTRLAKHFMEELKKHKLIDYNETVSLTKGNSNGDIKQLGDLFWVDNQGDCEELKVSDLLKVSPQAILQTLEDQGIPAKEHGAIFQSIVQHVLDAIKTENVQNVPDDWLAKFVSLFEALASSDKSWIAPIVKLAATFNGAKTLQALLDAGMNINATDLENSLLLATCKGHVAALEVLINAGANINAIDGDGVTAVMFAAQKGHVAALQVLINVGANINATDRDSFTVVMHAAYKGHVAALQVLIKAGADINVQGPYDLTALMLAAKKGHVEALEVLIKEGADIKKKNSQDYTAMMLAVDRGQDGALRFLIEKEPTIDAIDLELALQIATNKGYVEVLKVLKEVKAKSDASDSGGAACKIFVDPDKLV